MCTSWNHDATYFAVLKLLIPCVDKDLHRWRRRRLSVGLFPSWCTYVSPNMVSFFFSFARTRHAAAGFPGTPSYVARQRSCAVPFTPQCVRTRRTRFVNKSIRLAGFSHFFVSQNTRSGWKKKVPHKHADFTSCQKGGGGADQNCHQKKTQEQSRWQIIWILT